MFCEKCGTKLKDEDKFCPVCGSKIDNSETLEHKEAFSKKRRGRKKIVLILFVSLILIALAATVGLYMIDRKNAMEAEIEKEEEKEKIEEQELIERKEITEEDKNTEERENTNKIDETEEDYASLEQAVFDYCETSMSGANYSFYFSDLDANYEYELNSHPSRAGASGRIFVIEYIVKAIEDGRMQASDELLDIIKTTSTGEEPSSYSLVEKITGNYAESLDLVRDYVEQMGYENTSINRFYGESGTNAVNSPNQTSARDTGVSISHIYNAAENGNDFASEVLEILASESSSKKGIAKAVKKYFPEATVYNFPGSYIECENDAAVVVYNGKPYIISFMMGDLHVSEGLAEQAMQYMQKLTDIVCAEGIEKTES